MLPPSGHYYDDQTYENYRQHYARIPSANYQQRENEQQLRLLSLGNKTETKKHFLYFNNLF